MENVVYETEKQALFKMRLRKAYTYSMLILFGLFILLPFYWMVLTSLKTSIQATTAPPDLWLRFADMQFVNYRIALFGDDVFVAQPYLTFMANTVIVAAISTVGTIITTILSAFAFARLNFRFKELFFLLLIMTMMIPGEMFVITNFITVFRLGWLGTGAGTQTYVQALMAMSIPFMTSIFYIFFLRQTFKTIPDELYYAAKVDGTTDFKYLWKVMIPIAKPTIITITILNAMGTWNAFIWPNLVAREPEYFLVSNGLRNAYSNNIGIEYQLQMASALIVTFPILVVFFLLKKHIMRGVSRSGIKG